MKHFTYFHGVRFKPSLKDFIIHRWRVPLKKYWRAVTCQHNTTFQKECSFFLFTWSYVYPVGLKYFRGYNIRPVSLYSYIPCSWNVLQLDERHVLSEMTVYKIKLIIQLTQICMWACYILKILNKPLLSVLYITSLVFSIRNNHKCYILYISLNIFKHPNTGYFSKSLVSTQYSILKVVKWLDVIFMYN